MKHLLIVLVAIAGLASCTNNGKKISKDYLEVFYKDGVSKEEAEKVLNYVYPVWRTEGDKTSKKSIQLTRTGDTVNFRMVAKMKIMNEMEENVFYTMGNELSLNALNGAPVNVVLTDKSFKEVKSYTFRKMDVTAPDFGEKITRGNIEVFVTGAFDNDEASRLADYLDKEIHPAHVVSFQVGKDANGQYLLRMVSSPEKASTLPDSDYYELAQTVSSNVFNNAPVTFQLTDDTFKPFKTFEQANSPSK